MSADAAAKIRVVCPSCQKQLAVAAVHAGKVAACPGCSKRFPIPHGAPPSAAAVASGVSAGGVSPPAAAAPFVARPPAPSAAAPPPVRREPLAAAVAGTPGDESAAPAAEEPASPFDFAANDFSPSARARRNAAAESGEGGGAFAPERKGMQMGVVGGFLMMAIAVVWFIGGLAVGYIFFYPPILFIIGLVGLFKGLLDGNLAGNRRRRY